MAVGYGPTPGVYPLHVGGELVGPGEDHRGEGFVYLDPVQIVHAEPRLLERQARSRDDAGELHNRVLAYGDAGQKPRPRHEAVSLRPLAVPDEHRRGPVGELGGVARRHDPLRPEDGPELRHLLGVYVVADTLVRRKLYL